MTQSEFIKNYCENSKVEEEKLNKVGRFAVPCDCNQEGCEGWAMVSKESLKSQLELYMRDVLDNEE